MWTFSALPKSLNASQNLEGAFSTVFTTKWPPAGEFVFLRDPDGTVGKWLKFPIGTFGKILPENSIENPSK